MPQIVEKIDDSLIPYIWMIGAYLPDQASASSWPQEIQ
jgi:hypothetical protein